MPPTCAPETINHKQEGNCSLGGLMLDRDQCTKQRHSTGQRHRTPQTVCSCADIDVELFQKIFSRLDQGFHTRVRHPANHCGTPAIPRLLPCLAQQCRSTSSGLQLCGRARQGTDLLLWQGTHTWCAFGSGTLGGHTRTTGGHVLIITGAHRCIVEHIL
eukprot:365906-Chlamydomonas_euryale.AAC.24